MALASNAYPASSAGGKKKPKKTAPAASPEPARRPRTKRPVSPFAPLNEKQIQAEANRRLNAILGPQQEAIETSTKHGVDMLSQAGLAAAALMQGIGPRVQEGYDTAARELSGIAGGFTGSLREGAARDAAAAGDFSRSQGLPVGAPPVDPAALSDALYQQGAAIPGSSLVSQGAAARGQAEAMPGISALQTQSEIAALTNKGTQELVDLAKTRPELRDKVLDVLYSREVAKLNARVAQQNADIRQQAQDTISTQLGETTRHHVATEGAATRSARTSERRARIAEKNYQLQLDKHEQAIATAEREGRAIDPSASKVAGYLVDESNNPILDKHGNKIPVATSSGNKSDPKSGLTKAQARTNSRMAADAARKMFKDSQPKRDEYGNVTTPGEDIQLYEVINYLMDGYGLPRSQARKLAIDAGFKPNKKAQAKYRRTHRR